MRLARAMKAVFWFWHALLVLNPTNIAHATPLSDLGSPSPEVRTRAAEIIRSKHLYKATSRDKWDKAILELREGQTAQDVLDFLQRHGIEKISPSFTFDRNAIYSFRLDDSWELLCAINRIDRGAPPLLTEYKIVERPKEIFVAPPPGFTGIWRNYRINGEPFGPEYYNQGKGEILF
jgi:hypothetical protein